MDCEEHNKIWIANLNDLDTGVRRPSDYVHEVNKAFGKNFSVKEYFEEFLRAIWVNKPILDALGGVKGVEVVVVSDTLSPISSGLPKLFGKNFSHYKKFYSNIIGMQKSNGMLEYVPKTLGARPDECILIDDNLGNVNAAICIGMRGLKFESNEQTFSELKKLGIKFQLNSA